MIREYMVRESVYDERVHVMKKYILPVRVSICEKGNITIYRTLENTYDSKSMSRIVHVNREYI